ncbi:MAG TPA: hypothetical protein VHX38_11070 [Pseudonocardiaceae bacterium]|nr:hypothetical protein [Pseudonocardiaceae bacterium]
MAESLLAQPPITARCARAAHAAAETSLAAGCARNGRLSSPTWNERLAEAVERVCCRLDPAFRLVSLEILGNTDAFSHAHSWPRRPGFAGSTDRGHRSGRRPGLSRDRRPVSVDGELTHTS